MRLVRTAAGVVLGVALLAGCQSIANMTIGALARSLSPDPWERPVEAAQLARVETPDAEALAPAAAAVEADSAPLVEAAAEPEPQPEAAPERTNIRGQGDGSMTVDTVRVEAAGKPIAHTTPDFSREQTANMLCLALQGRGGGAGDALNAYRATVAGWEAREAFLAGRITLKQANDVEKKRQQAVKDIWGIFAFLANRRKKDLPPPAAGALVLEKLDLFTFEENGRQVMVVSGVVRNTVPAEVEVPPISLQQLDAWEFVLAGQSSLLPFATLGPMESKAFETRVLNPPDTTFEVYAHFAPPFNYRANRACDGFDASKVTAEQAKAADARKRPPSALPRGQGPAHTAAELNAVMTHYRRDAERAWQCRRGADSGKDGEKGLSMGSMGTGEALSGVYIRIGQQDLGALCAQDHERPAWRDLFVMAEAADEAWGAALAAEAAPGNADAQAAQQASTKRLVALGAASLVRSGNVAPGVVVETTNTTYGFDPEKEGHYLDLAVTLRNTGAEARRVDALMVAMVDRLELPLRSYRVAVDADLAPGETREVKRRFRNFGALLERARPEEAPPWTVRVGAMGR